MLHHACTHRLPTRAKRAAGTAIAIAAAIAVSACGGGGGDDDNDDGSGSNPSGGGNTSSAAGLYTGTTSTGRSVTGLVLDDGTYYFLYSSEDTPSGIGGVVQGSGGVSGSNFTSSDMRDFNIEGLTVQPGSVNATFSTGATMSGTLSYAAGGSESFQTTYDKDFETVPTLSAVAGSYSGTVAFSEGYEAANVSIAQDGTVSGAGSSGCKVSGSLSPRKDGNVYDLTLSFGGDPCLFANQTFHGIAYYQAAEKRLYAAAPNGERSDGVLYVADKR